LAASNLGDSAAMMSAVGNDVGFKHVFVRQAIAQVRAANSLVGVSTSCNSENLLADTRWSAGSTA
jgi:D-sedoheptulose 7-phosphate isomerase